jgi:hypothetical protein
MSLGANLSSGYTNNLNQAAIKCGIPVVVQKECSNACSNEPPGPKNVQIPSLIIPKVCPPPTPAEFARYPKVAVPCSVYTEALSTPNGRCAALPAPTARFAQYNRYQPPLPCAPLPQSANMAGISKPSTRLCNITIPS